MTASGTDVAALRLFEHRHPQFPRSAEKSTNRTCRDDQTAIYTLILMVMRTLTLGRQIFTKTTNVLRRAYSSEEPIERHYTGQCRVPETGPPITGKGPFQRSATAERG